MDFPAAKHFVLPFGKHQGRAIDEVAQTDEGLLYCSWPRDQMDEDPPHFGMGRDTHVALTIYLEDPLIARELSELL